MLKSKRGVCVDCPPDKGNVLIYASGRCYNHYWISRRNAAFNKSKSRFILYDKNKIANGELTLNEWFKHHVANSNWVCENCGAILQPNNDKIARSFQAHILPKNIFRSVSTDINNRMLLGAMNYPCNCHGQYDSNWDNASQMKIFPIALDRFLLFAHKLSNSEIGKLPEQFKMKL